MSADPLISHVSDTALWVAYYRAEESKRPDALFQDPYAERLAGPRGRAIAEDMKQTGRYTRFAVVMRTLIIDRMIEELIREKKINLVLNLGAGLDSRPYRMNLPADLKWVEVDHEKLIESKSRILKNEKPRCQLERVGLDLADDAKRVEFLNRFNNPEDRVLVLTEGVVPYLSEEQVSKLAWELHHKVGIQYWILEYLSPESYSRIQKSLKRGGKMERAPFQFFPAHWIGFFETKGWSLNQLVYSSAMASEVGRSPPFPWYWKILMKLMPPAARKKILQMTGFLLLAKQR